MHSREKEWEAKKKYFEKESGRKKPSEKYLGFFRKGSGVSKAFGNLDAAIAKIGRAQGKKRVEAQIGALSAHAGV